MSTIVWGDLPVDEFALQETFDLVPDAAFQCEQVVQNAQEVMLPLLWAGAEDTEALDDALEADPSVDDARCLARCDEETLYNVEWQPRVQLVLEMMLNSSGTLLDAHASNDHWRFRLYYPGRDDLSETNEFCEEHGLSFDVRRVRELDSEPASRYGLTEEQFESLRLAWQRGYFDVPRETGIEELAEELDISHQALSERLRRAHGTLVENMIGVSARGRPRASAADD